MDNNRRRRIEGGAMMLIFVAYFFRETHLFVSNDWINPFPFSKQIIAKDTYVWMLWLYVFFTIYNVIVISLVSKDVRIYFWTLIILATLEVIEFTLNYNERWYAPIPFNITVARFFVLFYVGSKIFRRWRQKNQNP